MTATETTTPARKNANVANKVNEPMTIGPFGRMEKAAVQKIRIAPQTTNAVEIPINSSIVIPPKGGFARPPFPLIFKVPPGMAGQWRAIIPAPGRIFRGVENPFRFLKSLHVKKVIVDISVIFVDTDSTIV